jgi:hypothetical protein
MELVTDPAILILDEPTSGLDSYTALLLMKMLKQVPGHGYHLASPRSNSFAWFQPLLQPWLAGWQRTFHLTT